MPSLRRLVPLALTLAACLLLAPAGCGRRQHFEVDRLDELGYPTCADGSERGAPELLADRRLRSGQDDTRGVLFEQVRIERRGCLRAVTVRQATGIQIADVEAIYDENLLPLRLWRRFASPRPGAPPALDLKRFDFRTPELGVKHLSERGKVDFEVLRGKNGIKPRAIIGPGRGLLTAWLWRAKLGVGQKLRERVLDFRAIEILRDVTLMRHEDRDDPALGRRVRVYTIYGREPFFTDENDVVLGDLAGLLPAGNEPLPPLPELGAADPVNTP
ncbi:MAG: hypothetical protein MUF34_03230 [Polyangiaceae bacterium]|jgi:hypothetical protein|nr:hypothetical protein [Polyangiaceae bacterium]